MRDIKKQILFIGNWKMNPGTEKEAIQLFKQLSVELKRIKQKIYICPPAIFIPALSKIKTGSITLGLQNTAPADIGAYTGEVSLMQAAFYKVRAVLIGHSEVRARGETDSMINKKVQYAHKKKIMPIVCVGESLRDESHEYFTVIKDQIIKAFTGISKKDVSSSIIAYEPVWAIGVDAVRDATPEEFYEIKIFIKKILGDAYGLRAQDMPKILYGGSVTEKNARAFVEKGDVDGFLVGRTSLDIKKSIELLKKI